MNIGYRIGTDTQRHTITHRFWNEIWNAPSFNVMYLCIFGFQLYNNLKRIRKIIPNKDRYTI